MSEPSTLRFADLPEADSGRLRRRLRPPSRRSVIGGLLGTGAAVGLGSLALVNRGAERAGAAYYRDYTDQSSGPCANYAREHTEHGIQCGPSPMCLDQSCCWKYRNGAGNLVGWHKHAPGSAGYYLHRPDQCWSNGYDAWQWRFSDGHDWRCSDGFACSPGGSCAKMICPWQL